MTLHGFDVVVIILLSSGVALSYNVVHSLMIQHTSAVATTVIGEVRAAGPAALACPSCSSGVSPCTGGPAPAERCPAPGEDVDV